MHTISISILFMGLFMGLCFFSSCNPNAMTLGDHLKKISQNESLNHTPNEFENFDLNKFKTNNSIFTTNIEASDFIKTAHTVMINEGPSLGTACNYYLERTLFRAGFSKGTFRANTFHIYAKKNFHTYKTEAFQLSKNNSAKQDLKNYLWSYPERTPFILQWVRQSQYGHVAIVERIADYLIIYQSSLGNYSANRKLTTVDQLLNAKTRSQVLIYSEFTPLL